jgi:S-adenosylmethionine decarboxylase
MERGKHLVIDVLTKNSEKLTDKKFTRDLFKTIIKEIKMKAVLPITLYQFPSILNDKNKKGGITAFCILEESHLSCHSWPEENYIAYDVYSCKNFDEKKVIRLIKKFLPVKKLIYKVISRSVDSFKI